MELVDGSVVFEFKEPRDVTQIKADLSEPDTSLFAIVTYSNGEQSAPVTVNAATGELEFTTLEETDVVTVTIKSSDFTKPLTAEQIEQLTVIACVKIATEGMHL